MIRIKITGILFLLFCVFYIKAQDSLSIDARTYQLYLDKKWNELIKVGNKELKKGNGFFYLEMRVGIAYYEKKNYCLAEDHFRKALGYNSGDELALEYLYYCYVFTGKNEAARMLSRSFSKELAEKTGVAKQSEVAFITFEGGTKLTDSSSYYDTGKKSETNYFDPAIYAQLSLNHYIKNRVSVFHAATHYKQTTFLGTTKQNQYYLSVTVPTRNNWLFAPAFHYIHLNVTTESGMAPPPMGPGPGQQKPPPHRTTTITSDNYVVGSLAVQKKWNRFNFGLGSTFSNMSNVNQFLHSVFASYSPFGNSKLVLGNTCYAHTVDSYSTMQFSDVSFIYVQPVKAFWVKFSYLVNNNHNIIEDNGYIVNNSQDLTKQRGSVLANVTVSKHVSLYALYQLEFKQENVQKFNYRYNVILGGIKIIP